MNGHDARCPVRKGAHLVMCTCRPKPPRPAAVNYLPQLQASERAGFGGDTSIAWTIDRAARTASTEASDLRAHGGIDVVRCPGCDARVGSKLLPVRDRENECTHWEGTCECGLLLTIFND